MEVQVSRALQSFYNIYLPGHIVTPEECVFPLSLQVRESLIIEIRTLRAAYYDIRDLQGQFIIRFIRSKWSYQQESDVSLLNTYHEQILINDRAIFNL